MVWIINSVPKVVSVPTYSNEALDSENVYLCEADAYKVFQTFCKHETRIGNRSTGRIQCADCRKQFN